MLAEARHQIRDRGSAACRSALCAPSGSMAEADVDRAGREAAALHQRGEMIGGVPGRLGGLSSIAMPASRCTPSSTRATRLRRRPAGRSHRRRPSRRRPASARSRRSPVRAAPRRWRRPDRDDRRAHAPPRGRGAPRSGCACGARHRAARSGCRHRFWRSAARTAGPSAPRARASASPRGWRAETRRLAAARRSSTQNATAGASAPMRGHPGGKQEPRPVRGR